MSICCLAVRHSDGLSYWRYLSQPHLLRDSWKGTFFGPITSQHHVLFLLNNLCTFQLTAPGDKIPTDSIKRPLVNNELRNNIVHFWNLTGIVSQDSTLNMLQIAASSNEIWVTLRLIHAAECTAQWTLKMLQVDSNSAQCPNCLYGCCKSGIS